MMIQLFQKKIKHFNINYLSYYFKYFINKNNYLSVLENIDSGLTPNILFLDLISESENLPTAFSLSVVSNNLTKYFDFICCLTYICPAYKESSLYLSSASCVTIYYYNINYTDPFLIINARKIL